MKVKRGRPAYGLPLQTVTMATVVALLHGCVLPYEIPLRRAVLCTGNVSGSRTASTPQVLPRSSIGRQMSKAVVVQSLPLPHPYLILS
jgi:hypothetical protein